MNSLTKIYQQKPDCRTESIETGISEHGKFLSDSIKRKVITTMKGRFYFTIAYNKMKYYLAPYSALHSAPYSAPYSKI